MMMGDDLRPGTVVTYPYLWRWQRDRAESEGRKDRPACVVVAVRGQDGLTHVALLAISSQPPRPDQVALEIPEIERRRAGLSDLREAWITVSEFNYDVVERSFYFEPQAPLGRFGRSFLKRIAEAVAPAFASRRMRVDRTDR